MTSLQPSTVPKIRLPLSREQITCYTCPPLYARWQGIHNKLITHLEEALNAILPAPYVANSEVRCYIEAVPNTLASAQLRPDVAISRPAVATGGAAVGVALQHAASGSFIVEVKPLEVVEAYVDIVDARDRS